MSVLVWWSWLAATSVTPHAPRPKPLALPHTANTATPSAPPPTTYASAAASAPKPKFYASPSLVVHLHQTLLTTPLQEVA
jgi:hypothetical protein